MNTDCQCTLSTALCGTFSAVCLQVKRYKTYVRLLQYKMAAFAELEPSLAETAIGEVDEPEHESAGVTCITASSLAGYDISAVPSDVEHQQHDIGMPAGLGTLHEM